MSLRKELAVVLSVALVGWLVVMVVLARWQQSGERHKVVVEPDFPHYPGTEAVEEQTSPSIGFRKYWFTLEQDYPSLSVFDFYRRELEAKGWRLATRRAPRWSRQQSKGGAYDVFHATWLDPKNLFQLDLEMTSAVKMVEQELGGEREERQPGIEVYVTMRRVLVPGFALPPEPVRRPRPEVEVE